MKKRYKKKKFKKLTFMLSERQMKSLNNYCDARNTTPNKLLKKSIRLYIENFDKSVPQKYHVQHNQLDLFKKEPDTLSMFE
ncbi:MAG: hypothetical protein H8E34_10775 [Bacteroidetes bacterium]|nr:hypothetical protein [Bacteroidota bacterium]MBL6944349.1 hypothetical protein [Bacteroidales bacterium]